MVTSAGTGGVWRQPRLLQPPGERSVFPNLNCLMGCEGVSAGRAQAPGDVGKIVQSACLSHLLAASTEMLSKTGACGRADGARELSLGMCQRPALLAQGLPGSDLPEPSSGHESAMAQGPSCTGLRPPSRGWWLPVDMLVVQLRAGWCWRYARTCWAVHGAPRDWWCPVQWGSSWQLRRSLAVPRDSPALLAYGAMCDEVCAVPRHGTVGTLAPQRWVGAEK